MTGKIFYKSYIELERRRVIKEKKKLKRKKIIIIKNHIKMKYKS